MLESISPLGFRRLDFRNAARFAKTRGIIYKSADAAPVSPRRDQAIIRETCVQGGTTGTPLSASQATHMQQHAQKGRSMYSRLVEGPKGESKAMHGCAEASIWMYGYI